MTDVIILSNAKTNWFWELTQHAVKTCFYNTNEEINIIVIEQHQKSARYESCITFKLDEPFNYNRFANIGVRLGTAENIVIANNDLVFTTEWLEELIKAYWPLVSPKCPNDVRQKGIKKNTVGEINGKIFSGWCFMIKRSLWEKIDGFDEDFHFWGADNSLIEQVKSVGVLPMLVPSSIVVHLGSQTLKTMDNKNELTWEQIKRFNKKYNKNLFNAGIR